MRMRNKKHAAERIEAVGDLLIKDVNEIPNFKPLHIEIGCGKGAFITEMARQNPDINYVAIEKITSVIVIAMEKAAAAGVNNVKFLMGDANTLSEIEKEHFCERIYLNFSDPWPKKKQAKRRLTAKTFLDIYKKILTPDGAVFFKTDNRGLFEFSLNSLSDNDFHLKNISLDLHASDFEGNVMTEYEKNFSSQGMPIYRVEAYTIPKNVLTEKILV